VVDSKTFFFGRKNNIPGNRTISTMRERTILIALKDVIDVNLMAYNKNTEARAPAHRATFA
jgi:hypothetical protein